MRVIRVEITGRVQGIGFRWFIREHARALRLAGWVRNLTHGSVEVAAGGDESAIDTLMDAARRGPPGARVTGVTPLDPPPAADLDTPFNIRP